MIISSRTTKTLQRHGIGSNLSLVCVIMLLYPDRLHAFSSIYTKKYMFCYCSCTILFLADIGWRSHTNDTEWYSGWCPCVPIWCYSHKFNCLRQVSLSNCSYTIFFFFCFWIVLKIFVSFLFWVWFIEQLQNEGLKLDTINQTYYFPWCDSYEVSALLVIPVNGLDLIKICLTCLVKKKKKKCLTCKHFLLLSYMV